MTATRTLDVSELPAYEISGAAPLWWGQLLLCLIEGSMLCMLIAIYFYLRLSVDTWPAPQVLLPRLTLPTVALIPLIASAIGSWEASQGAKRNSRDLMLAGMVANLFVAGVFFVCL